MNSNRFSQLEEVDLELKEDGMNTTNLERKALKKLREIEYLEFKPILTPKEWKKVANKSKWANMLSQQHHPTEEPKKTEKRETPEEKKARKVFEKELRTLEKKEAKIRKDEMRCRQRKKAIAQEKLDAEKRKCQRIEQELLEKAEKYRRHKSRTIAELEKEWNFSLRHMYQNNVSKTFRFMSIKYHPDKCEHQDDTLQKYLGLLRDKSPWGLF